ncbi:MAG: hypothetical protein ABEJ28_03535 [Salinigranum sp.]
MSMSEVETGSSPGRLERAVGLVVGVTWAVFTILVGAIVVVTAWAAVDIGPSAAPLDPAPFVVLAAAAALGTLAFVVVAVVDV